VKLLAKKSEAADVIKEFVKMSQTQFGKTPKCFRSDRGGEFVSKDLDDFYRQQGIKQQTTAPYSPQQNGKAERKNRTLVEMTRCMLCDANMPNKYWGEAILMANHIQNRLPTKATGRPPCERWYNKLPDLSYMQKFGTTAYILDQDPTRGKLDLKGKKLVLIGYQEGSKAYRLLDTNTDRVYISRDVKFLANPSETVGLKDVSVQNHQDKEIEVEAGQTPVEQQEVCADTPIRRS